MYHIAIKLDIVGNGSEMEISIYLSRNEDIRVTIPNIATVKNSRLGYF